MITINDIEKLENRYNKLVREKERQQIRLEEANKKLAEYGISAIEIEETVKSLENKISEMEEKLETNISKLDKKITELEELI